MNHRNKKAGKPKAVATKAAKPPKISIELYQIQEENNFLREYGEMDNHSLARAAHDMEMLGFKLRHLLWLRHYSQYQGN